jgi:hypothetical protein
MDSVTVERFITSRDHQQTLYAYSDTIMKALAYCAVTSKGKFAESCQEVWQKLADTKEI